MGLVGPALVMAGVAAVMAGLLYVRNMKRLRRRRARSSRMDAEMRRNTWFNAFFRRNPKIKRITYKARDP